MNIRRYQESDCSEIADLFHSAVHAIDQTVYSKEQQEAWAPTPVDYDFWRKRLTSTRPFVATSGGVVVGFVELLSDGYIDCLYVHKDHQGSGIAGYLMQQVFEQAKIQGLNSLYVDASDLAMPLFKKYGFKLFESKRRSLRGQLLSQHRMSLDLCKINSLD